ncbi:MAG: GntR family transcriptional regulator [Propionibacteriaceae bacterium]|jgi:GntR family transcriptional regulator|nr:GntR family transcriptional regulator [Propionibacteriaceae bacterium]
MAENGGPSGNSVLLKDSPKPLYMQLEELLRAEIVSGEYTANQMIPSEVELSRRFGISRMTARAVVTQLVQEGLLHRVQGKGTFVVEPKIEAKSLAYQGIREQLESMGYSIDTKLLEFKTIPADVQLARVFSVPRDEPLLFVKRLRSVEGTPISLHTSYMPQALCPSVNQERLIDEQLCVILAQDYNLTASSVVETLESSQASTSEAKHLGVERRFPLLLLTDTYRAGSGRIFEHTKVLFRGDKVKLQFEYGPNR